MDPQATENKRLIAGWLFICCGLVFVMVTVGAITRLTESGLSMVEWRPLMGALPPLSEQEWARVFELYKQSPEYRKENFWMTIGDFKTIFFWEWFHRLLGRLIGLVYALPLLYFWLRGMIPSGYKAKLSGLLVLGGLQGLMGWYMVKSGLVEQPDVSHYRLAAHLGLAFLIFALLLWLGLGLTDKERKPDVALYVHGWGVLGVLIITIFWGAYTAGLDAGLIYNESFPKMGGEWIPGGLLSPQPHQPVWINFFETHIGVQFMHRWLAMLSLVAVISLWLNGLLKRHAFPALHMLALMALIQVGLGITTLLSQVWLPVATLHQAGALMLLTILIIVLYRVKP